MKHLIALFLKYKVWLLTVLKPMGFWGAGAISLLDSSSMPVPMDPIMAFYAWNNPHRYYLFVIMAALGSAIGGLLPFLLGRAGGELFLLKRIEREKYEKLRDRFERQEFLALLIPSMLPPPTPWKVFVFGAGVFEMRTTNFLLAVFLGRLVRFGIEGYLAIRYGPEAVGLVGRLAHEHHTLLLSLLGLVIVAIAVTAIRKGMARRQMAPPAV